MNFIVIVIIYLHILSFPFLLQSKGRDRMEWKTGYEFCVKDRKINILYCFSIKQYFYYRTSIPEIFPMISYIFIFLFRLLILYNIVSSFLCFIFFHFLTFSTILFNFILFSFILFHPILSYTILSYPILFLSSLFYNILHFFVFSSVWTIGEKKIQNELGTCYR